MLPSHPNHTEMRRYARRILAGSYNPNSPAVRLARAYLALHEKSGATLRGLLKKVDGAIASIPEEGGERG